MAKRILKWTMDVEQMVCSFEETGKAITFRFTELEGVMPEMTESIETEDAEGKEVKVDNIPFLAMRHGLKQKLADSIAGMKDETEETKIEVMTKVWDFMAAGTWSSRKPSTPKVDLKAIKEKLANMDETEAEIHRETLRTLGIMV